ncbi:MAG TPA: type II toxin-antitoxin system RelE/ParE family toxin [Candidatus Angelobacter sp.]|nr:type II toxin-antitoxin system RelE/ParE family toxin [Candidatus Angelobacter sp.]
MIVQWTATAVRHLTSIHDYIAQDSPIYARRVVDRLTRRSQQIVLFPLSGRVVPEHGSESIREIIEPPYRIIYRIHRDRVDVVAVVHGARNLRDLPL